VATMVKMVPVMPQTSARPKEEVPKDHVHQDTDHAAFSPLVAETKPAKTPLTSNPWEKKSGNVELGSANATRIYAS